MTQINLLPWREQERKEKKVQFGAALGVSVFIAVFVIVVIHTYYSGLVHYQNNRNAYLNEVLTNQSAVIADLNKKKEELNTVNQDLQFMFSLRDNSYASVKVLDVLENLIPDGITFTKISRERKTVTILGVAQSNLQVTELMKNLDESPIFKSPSLTQLSADDTASKNERRFEIKTIEEGPGDAKP